MDQEVVIRQVILDDLDRCHRIEQLGYGSAEAATREKILKRINLYPQGFVVASQNGEVIGFVNSGATNKVDLSDELFKDMIGHDPEGRNLVIMSVVVHEKYQGQGIAGMLLKNFISNAKRAGKDNIFLMCKSPLISFYGQYGFEYLRESNSRHGGVKWHEMVLKLERLAK
jgi:ribosomal protein S18 acetylase RimI-like enzyme